MLKIEKKQYTAEYKAKLIIEVLSEEKHISEIAARENISRTQLQNWKREFLENSSRVFSQDKLEKDILRESKVAKEHEEELMKKIDQLTIENDWL